MGFLLPFYNIQQQDVSDEFLGLKVLQQYFVPRNVSHLPFESIVLPGERPEEKEFEVRMVDSYISHKTPNPWSYSATFIAYENKENAKRLLNTVSNNSQLPRGQAPRYPPWS